MRTLAAAVLLGLGLGSGPELRLGLGPRLGPGLWPHLLWRAPLAA